MRISTQVPTSGSLVMRRPYCLPEIDLQPVVDIADADTGAVLRLMRQNGADQLIAHAYAVVLHREYDVLSVLPHLYGDAAFIYQQIKAVVDGVSQ